MKKILAIIMGMMLVVTSFSMGCSKTKPVIELSTDELEVKENFTLEYELPTAQCKSTVDKKRLKVETTAKDSRNNDVRVEEGYLYPTTLGEYTVFYNAKDKDKKQTPADEVIFKVTFEDRGPVVEEHKGNTKYKKINQFTEYIIPDFTDIADVSYDLHKWTSADFIYTKSAKFQSKTMVNGEEQLSDPVEVTNIDGINTFDIGLLTITYTYTPKANKSKSYTYDFIVNVGDVLFNDLVDKGADVTAEKSLIVDESLKKDGPILKISAPLNEGIWPGWAWPGMKLMGPNALFTTLNNSPDHAIVLRCYNPTNYWGKYYFSSFDDDEFTGEKGPYENKYRVAPHEFFDMIIPKNLHVGNNNIFQFSIELRDMFDPNVTSGKDFPYFANELYILGCDLVNEAEISANVWENNAVPTLKAYTTQSGTDVAGDVEVSQYDKDSNGVEGMLVKKTGSSNMYLDFLSDSATAETINNNFAKVHRSHKFDRFFAVTVNNIMDKPLSVWAMLGNGVNQPEYNPGWLYEVKIPAGESRDIYYGANTRNDEYDIDSDFTCIRLNTDAVSEFVISDARIITYPTDTKAPLDKWEISKITEAHSEKNLAVRPDTEWTVPAFETLYNSNHDATAVVSSVKYYAELGGEKIDVDTTKNTVQKGYYDVNYEVTETATGLKRNLSVTFTAIGEFDFLQKPGTEGYRDAVYGEKYEIPAYDTLFRTDAEHIATVKSVMYKADIAGEWVATEDYSENFIKVKAGFYQVTYEVTSGDKKMDVPYEISVSDKINPEHYYIFEGVGATSMPVTKEDGSTVIEYSSTEGWSRLCIADKPLIEAFNNSGNDAFLEIKGKNLSDGTIYICFLLDDLDYEDKNGMHYRAYPDAGEEFTILIPREICKIKNNEYIRMQLEEANKKIEISSVGMTYLSDGAETKAFDITEELVNGLKVENMTATYVADGKVKLSATGTATWNLLDNPACKTAFDATVAKNPYSVVVAMDVTNDTDEELTTYLNLGWNDTALVGGPLRNQHIPAHTTRTVYIDLAMVVVDWYANGNTYAKPAVDTLNLVLNYDGNNASGEMTYSNFRFINFAK